MKEKERNVSQQDTFISFKDIVNGILSAQRQNGIYYYSGEKRNVG